MPPLWRPHAPLSPPRSPRRPRARRVLGAPARRVPGQRRSPPPGRRARHRRALGARRRSPTRTSTSSWPTGSRTATPATTRAVSGATRWSRASTRRRRASTTAVTSRACCSKLDYIEGLGTDVDLADAELQEQGRPARGRAVGRLPRLLDHRLHPDRPAPRHQRRPERTGRRGARPRHEGLLRHHHQPHRGRHRLPGGCAAAVRRPRTTRPTRPAAGDGRSTTATTPGRTASRRSTPATSFPYTPVLDPAEQNLKVPAWLNDLTLYHNRGDTTFVGENSQYGDFFGLDDLFTENPKVVDGMIDIYKTWVQDFRHRRLPHRHDEARQRRVLAEVRAGPAELRARATASRTSSCSARCLDGSGAAAKSFTSHYTTHDKMQAILDFPFQDAARNFASRSRDNCAARRRSSPTTTGTPTPTPTPTSCRPSSATTTWAGSASSSSRTTLAPATPSWLARDKLAHELMYFSRGNPVVYYGDEQGFTGQRRRPGRPADDVRQPGRRSTSTTTCSGPTRRTPRTTSSPRTRCTRPSAGCPTLTEEHPALRNGAQQVPLRLRRARRLRLLADRPQGSSASTSSC